MGKLNFGQLEQLWVNNGGSAAVAPIMAAVALAESGGTPGSEYQTTSAGATGATGLWQIEWPLHQSTQQKLTGTSTRAALKTPTRNAKVAVSLLGKGPTGKAGTPWYTPTNPNGQDPIIKAWIANGSPADPTASEVQSWGVVSTTGAQLTSYSTPSSSGSSAGLSLGAIWSEAEGALKDVNAVTHDAAVVIDRFFGMFAPGQGVRLAIGAGALLCSIEGVRSWQAASREQGGGSFPLAVGLIGLAVTGGFMALRPWPAPGGKPMKPGAYAVDVLEGNVPTAPAETHEASVTAIQAGLDSLIVLWSVGKIASAFSAITGAVKGLLPAGGGGGGGQGDNTASGSTDTGGTAGDTGLGDVAGD